MSALANVIWVGRVKSGSSDPCKPSNMVLTPIVGGVRITFTQRCPLTETEVWISTNGAETVLVTTLAPGVETYDYTCDFGVTLTVSLRSKLDETVLNVPTTLVATEITGGVRLTWADNNTEADHIEIWAAVEGAATALLTTVEDGVQTYNHIATFTYATYKIRAKEGTLPVYSSFTSDVSFVTAFRTILTDTHTVAWYDYNNLSTITKDVDNLMTQWNDVLGSGHDLLATGAYRPTWTSSGILFDGISNNMESSEFAYAQPKFIYLVFKQITWTDGDSIYSGASGTPSSERITQNTSSPNLTLITSANINTNPDFVLDTWGILRVCLLNGTGNGKLVTNSDAPVTGNPGTRAGNGIVIGGAYNRSACANIQVKEAIFRDVNDGTSSNEATIYAYLKAKYGL